jgi:uncharacterized oxidoreductase
MPEDRTGTQPTARVRAAPLAAWGEQVFAAIGCSPREAGQVADALVESNLFGHDSHGIGLVPLYVDDARGGHAVPGRDPRVVSDAGSMVVLDGERGFGQSVGEAAMELAIERARAHGCAVVGLRLTHHLGRIGRWGEQCARAGLVSVHFVNVRSTPLVAPWGGSEARVSTNPVCIAVPHAPHPLVLDYATAAIALGKTRVAFDEGAAIEPGLMLDAHGEPSTEPGVMWQAPRGAILPFARHKGWALSVMCELLAGALTGGGVQDGVHIHPMLNNMLTLAFDPARLGTAASLGPEVATLAQWARSARPLAGSDGVLLPGEPERRVAAQREREGIPIARRTLDSLAACAASLGVPPPPEEPTP